MDFIRNRPEKPETMEIVTGYGPRRLMFDGNDDKYELWEVKFMGYMRTKKLHMVIEKPANETAETAPSAEKLSEAYAKLVNFWMTAVYH